MTNAKIIRYLTKQKFLDIVLNKRLNFTRACLFDDKQEGAVNEEDAYNFLTQYLTFAGIDKKGAMGVITRLNKTSDFVWVSSWSRYYGENLKMWQTFSNPNGVAIVSDISTLRNFVEVASFECMGIQPISIDSPAFKGVEYVEYYDKKPEAAQPYLKKEREKYSYEQEVRAFLSPGHIAEKPDNVFLSVDPQRLIEKIITHPKASELRAREYEELLQSLGLKEIPVIRSELPSSP